MIEETFSAGNSLLHRLDPRVKILAAVAYSIPVALLSRAIPMILALGLSILITALARLEVKALFKRLIIVNSIILLFWIVVPFTFDGETIFEIGPLAATGEGIIYAASVTIKSNAILLAFIALVATMPVAAAGHALQGLGFPVKVVTLLLLTYRYVFVIEEEYNRLLRAIKIRGFRARTSLHTYRTYAYLIGMLFVRSWDRAERVHRAMRCRGFEGKFYCLTQYKVSLEDIFFSVAMSLGVLAIGVTEWMIAIQ